MTTVLEGTWEEVAERAPEFAGHRVRLVVFDLPSQIHRQVHDPAEAKRKAEEFIRWANSHKPNTEPLSDSAISRANMYGDDA